MKIALVGSCPSSRLLAPFDDSEWQIWGCSPDNAGVLPRISAWFDLHGDFGWANSPKWEANYLAWMRAQSLPVYVQRIDLIPNGIEFPAKQLVDQFGPYWFTSSLSWMMAYALTQEATEIGIYGADMSTKNEYLHQKPAIHYWMEVAAHRGVPVYVPPESDLLQPPPLYGYSIMTPMGMKFEIRDRELGGRIVGLESQMEQLKYELSHLRGARDNNDYGRLVWTGHQESVFHKNLNLEK